MISEDYVRKIFMGLEHGDGWVVHFDGDIINRVRAYLDSAMVARLFEENPI